MLPLDCAQEFDPSRDAEFFSSLPARPAVFLLEPRDAAAAPLLGRTANLRRRLERLLGEPDPASRRLNLRGVAARVRYRLTASAFEQALALYEHARRFFPKRYRDLLRLRTPALVKVSLSNPYPRCYVTRRILPDRGFYLGPFPSRKAADSFAGEFLNLFEIRRCQIKIRRDPSFPGCIYSEMKMCLAPCFAGCSDAEYAAETSRVVAFLASGGASLTREYEAERDAASAALGFERAAAVQKKIEKLQQILRGLPELAARIEDINAAVLQPAAEAGSVAVFTVRGGWIAEPFLVRFGALASQPRSVEKILREQLQPRMNTDEQRLISDEAWPRTRCEALGENLALLARWFFGKPRVGEIFFPQPGRSAGAPSDWPYRRIIRACSRILAAK